MSKKHCTDRHRTWPTREQEKALYRSPHRSFGNQEIVSNALATKPGKFWTTDMILRAIVSRKPDHRLSIDERPRVFSADRSTSPTKRNSWVGCRHLVDDTLSRLIASGHVERAPTGRHFETKYGKTVEAKCYRLIRPYSAPLAADSAKTEGVAALNRATRMWHLPSWVLAMFAA